MSEYYTKTQSDAQATVIGQRIKSATLPATIKSNVDALPDTNFLTDAERVKLAGLEASRFRGTFSDLASIPLTGNVAGMYAHIDSGSSNDVNIAYWDNDDNQWIEGGTATSETAASIKTKYESNPDTNAFTNAEKTKLENLVEATGIVDFTAALDAALA